MRLTALLPMKANSSRVPGKNFRIIAGKPLYRWILNELLALDEIAEIIINTDAVHLLETDLKNEPKVRLRNRPMAIRGDEVSMNRIIEDDLAHCETTHVLMTHTTNPMLGRATIKAAIDAYGEGLSNGKDSLYTVNRHQTRFYRKDGSAINHDPKNLLPTQDLEPWFEENSCLYMFSPQSFKATEARIGTSPILFETPKIESADIDEPDDWILAQALLEQTRTP